MEDEQYKRYRKMKQERIACLFSKVDKTTGTIYFLISGQSRNRYKVSITTGEKGKIKCSCPDFSTGAKAQKCVCKHCLLIIYEVLELFTEINHPFFTRLYFTPDETRSIKKAYKSYLIKKLH